MKLTLRNKLEMVLSLVVITLIWACVEKTMYVMAGILLILLFMSW